MDVEPFHINVPDSKIQALKSRLDNALFPDELDGSSWARGSPLADVRRLTTYWREKYDWRAAEAEINKLPQFKTTIQADGFEPLAIHFVHHKSSVRDAIPLLFCHGWPGSFLEVQKLLPILASGDGKDSPAFSVVAPSIPNFGFSEGTRKKGFNLAQYAETLNKLMLKLGYDRYVTQGGDWGMMITRTMGLLYPDHVKASHINMIRSQAPKWLRNPLLALQHKLTPYSKRDLDGFRRTQWFLKEGSGYRWEQETKPQTLGYALADSPVALLAWMYEKLHDWTDNYPWTEDEILTWVSIYWFSVAGPAASLRIYYESKHDPNDSSQAPSVNAPTPDNPLPQGKIPFVHRDRTQEYIAGPKLGLAHFPKELSVLPHTWASTMGDVIYQSENTHGGHFAATEHPELIARDLRAMLRVGGKVFGVVPGKRGYVLRDSKL